MTHISEEALEAVIPMLWAQKARQIVDHAVELINNNGSAGYEYFGTGMFYAAEMLVGGDELNV